MDILLVYAITLAALVLFVRDDLVPTDLTALLILLALIVTGTLSIEEGLSGFSHPGTVAVAAMLVLSEAVNRAGALEFVTGNLKRLPIKSEIGAAFVVMLAAGVVSMLVSNTATTLIFIPLVLHLARVKNLAASRLLLPMAYAIILGGTCTLIGSSTNIVVNEFGRRYGVEPFGMFEFTAVGLAAFGAGLAYNVLAARRLLPSYALEEGIESRYNVREYMAEFIVEPSSALAGRTWAEHGAAKQFNVDLLAVVRGGQKIWESAPYAALVAEDVLLVHGHVDSLLQFHRAARLSLKEKGVLESLAKGEGALAEGVIAPASSLVGRTLKEADFRSTYGAFTLGIRTFGATILTKIAHVRLHVGDTLLVFGRRDKIEELRRNSDFLFFETVDVKHPPSPRKALTAAAVFAGVIAAAAAGLAPLVTVQLAGVALLVLLRVMSLKEIYRAVPWRIVVMIAGIIPLGIAWDQTGAAAALAGTLLRWAGPLGTLAVLSVIYWLTSALVEVVQKTPTAVLITPLAMAAAAASGINPKAMLVTVLFAASSCFASPAAYQVNAIVYGAGRYRFADFLRAGWMLKIILWLVVMWGAPRFWPS